MTGTASGGRVMDARGRLFSHHCPLKLGPAPLGPTALRPLRLGLVRVLEHEIFTHCQRIASKYVSRLYLIASYQTYILLNL